MRPGQKSLVRHRIQQDFWAELKKGAEMFAYRQFRDEDGQSWRNSTLPLMYGRTLETGKGLGLGEQQKPFSGLNSEEKEE